MLSCLRSCVRFVVCSRVLSWVDICERLRFCVEICAGATDSGQNKFSGGVTLGIPTPLCRFSAPARAKEKIAVKSLPTRASPACPGQIATARKKISCLFLYLFLAATERCLPRSTHTSLFVPSACNGVRTAPGVQHCCECARSARRNFRVSLRGPADFRPPVTLYAV